MKQETLKNLREAKAGLMSRLSLLERERETLRADIEALDRIIARYEEGEQGLFESFERGAAEFVGATMRKSILIVLSRKSPSAMRAKQIAQEIIDGGYETKKTAIALSNAVFANLSYLMNRGEVERSGQGLYKIKSETAIYRVS